MLIKLLIGSVFSFFISCILHYCSAKKVYIRNGIFEKNKRIFKNMQCVMFPLIIFFLFILIFILLAFIEIDFNLSTRFQTGAAVDL